MTGKRIGYVRVSANDQNPARQLDGVQIDKKFVEYASGKSTNRPELKAMLEFVREDDTVIVHSMDRLARNQTDLKTLVFGLVANKVSVHFVNINMTFTGDDSPIARFMLDMLGAVAELERAFIRERQAEGIAIAKAQGRYKGRAIKLNRKMIEELENRLTHTRDSKTKIAKDLGISRFTLYRGMELIEEKNKKHETAK